MTREKGFFYSPATGRAIDEELGKRAFQEFFKIERELAGLYKDPLWGKSKKTLEIEMGKAINQCVTTFEGSQDDKDILEAILWSMTNYLR